MLRWWRSKDYRPPRETPTSAGPVQSIAGVQSDGHSRAAAAGKARGQTTIDFVIGAAVFLLAVSIVFAIIPGVIDPFDGSQEKSLVADRIAAQLTDRMLRGDDKHSGLNQTCVNAFFNGSLADGGDCPIPFDEGNEDLSARLGLIDRHRVNITIQRDVDADGRLEILSTSGAKVGLTGHTRLAIGPTVPAAQSVVVSRRTAVLDAKDVIVVVKVW